MSWQEINVYDKTAVVLSINLTGFWENQTVAGA